MSKTSVSSNQRSFVTDDEISKHLMIFCIQLVHHSQWTSHRHFMCGSCIEIPAFLYLAIKHGLDDYMLDADQMFYNTGHYVTCPSVPFCTKSLQLAI